MRRITMALVATSAGVALIVGAKSGSAGAPRSALALSGGTRQASAAPGTGAGSGTTSAKASSGAKTATVTGSLTGSAVGTPYGTVQVQAVMKDGRLGDVVVLQQTSGGRSSMIDSYALPILTTEALKAQGANIDVVSGATFTSEGYAQSLQAALDAAGGR